MYIIEFKNVDQVISLTQQKQIKKEKNILFMQIKTKTKNKLLMKNLGNTHYTTFFNDNFNKLI